MSEELNALKGALVHLMHLMAGEDGAKDFCARLNDPEMIADSADWFRRLSDAVAAEQDEKAGNVLKRYYTTSLRSVK